MMKIVLGTVTPRRVVRSGPASELLQSYVERVSRYMPCDARNFVSEEKLLEFYKIGAAKGRSALVLADSRGQQVTSEEMAALVGGLQDGGTQQMLLGIGPADGWSKAALGLADRAIAFGRITLPHELAAVVAAEQVYRALTIRAGHPYHSGH